ncbi:MAG: radical SAM protein [Eggerthellaceae bacterium]|nr:radical SAM protein [Eggerthellaceae bacterium]
MQPTHIRLYGTAADSIVDGAGLRYAVFVQGCPHACPGCHNPESQPFGTGYLKRIETLAEEIAANKIINGVTLSGGEPLAQSAACLALAERLKAAGLGLWLYTGYRFEDIMAGRVGSPEPQDVRLQDIGSPEPQGGAEGASGGELWGGGASSTPSNSPGGPPEAASAGSCARDLVALCDVVVDGPFVEALQSYRLTWRGSSNQRVVDVPRSLEAGRVVPWESKEDYPTPPSPW